jgi:Rieske Fe-S protein
MPEFDSVPDPTAPLSRRTVVVGAGALGAGLVVAGCATAETAGGEPAGGASGTAAPAALGPASEVPVGSAKIYDEQGVVVTQAVAGSYAGFSTVCPHQGCAVATVQGPNIVCPCHGSTFALDGTVTRGPAQTDLESRAVTVAGDLITLA